MNSPHPSRQRSQQSNVDSRHYPQAFMLTIGFFSSKTLKLEMLWEALSFELKKLPIQQVREGIKKNRFFLGKSPKLWLGGGQES